MAEWSVILLEHNSDSGGVIIAHWECVDSETVGEETYSARAIGTCSFLPDPSADDFIPYNDLTEDVVLGWCWSEDVNKVAVEAGLTLKIEEQKAPTIEKGLPWT